MGSSVGLLLCMCLLTCTTFEGLTAIAWERPCATYSTSEHFEFRIFGRALTSGWLQCISISALPSFCMTTVELGSHGEFDASDSPGPLYSLEARAHRASAWTYQEMCL